MSTAAADVLAQLCMPLVAGATVPGGVATVQAAFGTGHAFKGGEINKLNKNWVPAQRSGDAAMREDHFLVTSRLRDLLRNDGIAKQLIRAMAKHVIGPGIATFADAVDGMEPDDDFNFEADEQFEYWAEEEADVDRKLGFGQMQWQHFCEVVGAGESIMLKCWDNTPDRTIPLCYQLLEAEQLDSYRDEVLDNGGKIVRGIEYDRKGRIVAYYIFDAHPYDGLSGMSSTKSSRVLADRVIHSYVPTRPSDHRGISWLTATMQSLRDIDWYIGNELTAAAIGALLTLVVKRENGSGSGIGLGDDDDTGSDFGSVRLGRGLVADIGAKDDIAVAESKRPNRDAKPFIDLMLQIQAMSVGISKLRATGDYSESSYTSARGAHLDDQAFFVVLQNWAARSFVRPVRRAHTVMSAAYGNFRTVGARQFQNRMRTLLKLSIQAPGREQLDPERETNAALTRIRGVLSTHRDECGLRGKDWRRNVMQIARERKFMELHGVKPDLSTYLSTSRQEDLNRVGPSRNADG
jgi:lambda family phage portal protein